MITAKRKKLYLAGIISCSILFVVWFTIMVFSFGTITTREVHRANKPVGMITKGNLFVQEIYLTQRFLVAIEFTTATWGRKNLNKNEIIFMDSSNNVLARKRIESIEVPDNGKYKIRFNKSLEPGKSGLLKIGIFSPDGDVNNCITLWTDTTIVRGKLYRIALPGEDLSVSIKNQPKEFLPGSLCVQTFESAYLKRHTFTLILLVSLGLVLIGILVYLLMSFYRVSDFIMPPDKLFRIIALTFGIIYIVVSPPITMPDEAGHFIRSFQIYQLNIFKARQTVPDFFFTLLDDFFLYPDKKTEPKKIIAGFDLKYQPEKYMEFWSYDLVIPYIPQAVGIWLGKTLNIPPLGWLYLGKIFSLLVAVMLISYAIRIIPVGKWILFFLGLMPMTLYQLASLSHDALTIGLTFLLTAMILKHIFSTSEVLRWPDFLLFFTVLILLALCKPPYFIVGLLFLLIPVKKFGSIKKYVIVIVLSILIMIFAFPSFYLIRGMITDTPLLELPLMYAQMGVPNPQLEFLLHDVFGFVRVAINDVFFHHRNFYLISLYGNLSWLELPMPQIMGTAYFVPVILISFLTAEKNARLNWRAKTMILLVFSACILLILTASYLYFTPFGAKYITGVQGRYFIPIAPLFFLFIAAISLSAFSSTANFLHRKLNCLNLARHNDSTPMCFYFSKNYFLAITIVFAIMALIYSVSMIINRFY